ncbi:MAG: serine/threonine-protein kinase [Methylacidiphilales bacterium]|nr:serine/threonine-protein kinase [Candidatus Methylacidiphilales bacterium]
MKVDEYHLTKQVGQGSFGTVYQTQDKLIGSVAIKVFKQDGMNGADCALQLKRLNNEIVFGKQFSHPNLLKIYSGDVTSTPPYLIMELVEGCTLSTLLNSKKLTMPVCLQIMRQLTNAVAKLHTHKVLHRDIKPANILMQCTALGDMDTTLDIATLKLGDFGLACNMRHYGYRDSVEMASSETFGQLYINLTKSNTIIGTATYMAPEQRIQSHVDQRADIYSVSVILAELLAMCSFGINTKCFRLKKLRGVYLRIPVEDSYLIPMPFLELLSDGLSIHLEFRPDNINTYIQRMEDAFAKCLGNT